MKSSGPGVYILHGNFCFSPPLVPRPVNFPRFFKRVISEIGVKSGNFIEISGENRFFREIIGETMDFWGNFSKKMHF